MPQQTGTILEVERRITELCQGFEIYLAEQPPFGDWAWHMHRETIELRKQFHNVSDAIDSRDFVVKHIGYTLVGWGMDNQAARLVPPDIFYSQLVECRKLLVALETYSIEDISNENVFQLLLLTIQCLRSSATDSQVVSGSKAIHHLLPSLLPPIDRRYTGKFFKLQQYHFSGQSAVGLERIAKGFAKIYQYLKEYYGEGYLSSLVGSTDWATSETKLIDNAIIGYVKRNNL